MLFFTSELGIFMAFLWLGSVDMWGVIVVNGLTRSGGFKERWCL